MKPASYISHYFENEAGPFLNICDLQPKERSQIISREKDSETGFNRFSHGEEFFAFRHLADDLLLELYGSKFGKAPRRPFYGVLGDADVVGGLYRDPYKISMPIREFASDEITFMIPDHFHLVSLMKRNGGKKMFGYQLPKDYSETEYPYFGKLLTYEELLEGFDTLKIRQHLDRERTKNNWYRYVETQIWSHPETLKSRFTEWIEVDPEPWTYNGTTYLQNYKTLKAEQDGAGNRYRAL
ncbi:MAG: hypothetical protein JJT75_10465 [Opitutales bacterium]|nr:hypothetical protein [Opitutales bacterium]MCH8540714.1 hypothetical protein [Opitutales bacterium]